MLEGKCKGSFSFCVLSNRCWLSLPLSLVAYCSHAPPEPAAAQATKHKRKTRMCWHWERTGNCPYAGRCRFAHSEEELHQADLVAAAGLASRVRELELEPRKHEAVVRHTERSAADLEAALLREVEALRRKVVDTEAALMRERSRAELAEARVLELEQSRSQQETGQAFAVALCETSTASFAELAAATGDFAASRILGRGGFGPVYRGELGGQAVAIKRLDQVSPPHSTLYMYVCMYTSCTSHRL
jgi:hypothetical protein